MQQNLEIHMAATPLRDVRVGLTTGELLPYLCQHQVKGGGGGQGIAKLLVICKTQPWAGISGSGQGPKGRLGAERGPREPRGS